MVETTLKRFGRFIILLFLQVFIFNHINIAGYATPLIYAYFILSFPLNTNRHTILLWGFFIGICFDIFSSTPGIGAASMTFTAFYQPTLLRIITGIDEENKDRRPSLKFLGHTKFLYYIAIGIFLHTATFYMLESFSFFHLKNLIINIIGSTLLSLLIITILELLNSNNKRK